MDAILLARDQGQRGSFNLSNKSGTRQDDGTSESVLSRKSK